jgi:hypothetical protein
MYEFVERSGKEPWAPAAASEVSNSWDVGGAAPQSLCAGVRFRRSFIYAGSVEAEKRGQAVGFRAQFLPERPQPIFVHNGCDVLIDDVNSDRLKRVIPGQRG